MNSLREVWRALQLSRMQVAERRLRHSQQKESRFGFKVKVLGCMGWSQVAVIWESDRDRLKLTLLILLSKE